MIRGGHLSRLPHPGVEPLANQPPYAPIIDPLLEHLAPLASVDGGETSPHLRLDSPLDGQLAARFTPLVSRLMRTVTFAKAVGKRLKGRVEERLHDPHHRPLDDLVLDAGLAYRPRLSLFLLHPHPCDRRRPRPLVPPPLVHVPQVFLQGLGLLLRRHVVHPRGTLLTGPALGFP